MSKGRLTTTDIAWGAGLFEGEGYLSLNGSRSSRHATPRSPLLGIGMTDEDVIRKFRDLFVPGMRIYSYQPKIDHYKRSYQIKVTGKRAVGLMLTFFSFLGSRRRERIKELLNAWKMPNRQRRFYRKPLEVV